VEHFNEGEEENKLVHTEIHEAYVKILEEIIEAKLKDTYTEDQIQGFYLNFTENFKEYEKENDEVVDILFGFTDFVKFKSQILKFKNGVKELSEDEKSLREKAH